jgi:alkanesulfonate monooxygenase SsuD/methylene tetrahydromethanopterin reductase-like flavin-dependent oxidoreductase (luciferase family)
MSNSIENWLKWSKSTSFGSSFEGQFKTYSQMRMFPKAAANRRGTIPLWVGGNGAASIRRAAELGDGWHPINLGPQEFAEHVAKYRAACERFGKQPGPICLRHMPGGRTRPDGGKWPLSGTAEEQAADVRAYQAAGLDELMLSVPARSVTDLVVELRRFMREVAPRV